MHYSEAVNLALCSLSRHPLQVIVRGPPDKNVSPRLIGHTLTLSYAAHKNGPKHSLSVIAGDRRRSGATPIEMAEKP